MTSGLRSTMATVCFYHSQVLKRHAVPSTRPIVDYLTQLNFKFDSQITNWNDAESEITPEQKKLRNIFHKHVKPKKQHELYRLGETCALVAKMVDCKTVVDAGAGVGHLSRFLSYRHGLDLICVESEEKFGAAAKKLDIQLEEACSKLGMQCCSTPKHITLTLSPYTRNLTEFLHSHLKLNNQLHRFGIIGLHTCGDLGPTLIRNFAHVPEIKFLLAIGCCYMKMDLNKWSANMILLSG